MIKISYDRINKFLESIIVVASFYIHFKKRELRGRLSGTCFLGLVVFFRYMLCLLGLLIRWVSILLGICILLVSCFVVWCFVLLCWIFLFVRFRLLGSCFRLLLLFCLLLLVVLVLFACIFCLVLVCLLPCLFVLVVLGCSYC